LKEWPFKIWLISAKAKVPKNFIPPIFSRTSKSDGT